MMSRPSWLAVMSRNTSSARVGTNFYAFTVGGGIRTIDDATRLISSGGRKGQHHSAAVKIRTSSFEVARKFGRCATVVNIDPRA